MICNGCFIVLVVEKKTATRTVTALYKNSYFIGIGNNSNVKRMKNDEAEDGDDPEERR